MHIEPFHVEEWMNAYETGAKYNIAETCVDSISLDQLFVLTGQDKQSFLDEFCARRLTYGDIEGAPQFRQGARRLYRSLEPEHIVPVHGASGANFHVFYSLIQPGDRVISVTPTYQQLYSIPASFGANLQLLPLEAEQGFLPDLGRLRQMAAEGVKMICLNNPNNPTGALMPNQMLSEIVEIARQAGAYILCDEVYRHLDQEDQWSESIADLYEKGISVGSMSKVFSMAGLRLGWIACRDQEARRAFLSHRDYNLISCGMFEEAVASLALAHQQAILDRNRFIVRTNLAILDQWVQKEPLLSYVKPQSGATALVCYDLNIPSREFCLALYQQTGAFVTPGDCFGRPHSMRIGYACAKETLEQGLAAISSFLREIKS